MKKSVLLSLLFSLTACASNDKSYYLTHPQKMEQALKQCPQKQPDVVSCNELRDIAEEFNKMSDEIRRNPQLFGQKILKLQEKIAKQKELLQNTTDGKEELKEKLKENQNELNSRLALVKLFESPEA